MPKTSSNPDLQPELIPHETTETTSEERAKKEEYRERLREYLRDPEFRKTPGFPIGEDEAILALSDPPHYTACPNPFLPEIIAEWQVEREEIRKELGLPPDRLSDDEGTPSTYHREPFAADVSEGKNDPIYNAHSYHTKVPHKAIMRYILHYTDPGDIVLDGFCGTGMTGVAAQMCGDRKEVENLGYYINRKGEIFESPDDEKPFSRLGARRSVLVDLSPAATFIAYNYNTPVNAKAFEHEARRILKEVEEECGWMYETWHPHCDDPDRVRGKINYTVWSDVFLCPQCGQENVFSDQAVDFKKKTIRKEFNCVSCNLLVSKKDMELAFETATEYLSGRLIKQTKRVPTYIDYSVGKEKFEKIPDISDVENIGNIRQLADPSNLPNRLLPDMQMLRVGRMKTTNVNTISDFFMPRQKHSLAALWSKAISSTPMDLRAKLIFFVEQAIWGMSILNRFGPSHFSQVNRALSGVFYAASVISEVSPWYNLNGKLTRLGKVFRIFKPQPDLSVIASCDLSNLAIPENSVEYIFTDPPFGENIYYSDLNILIESWHNVTTSPKREAIVDRVKQKTLIDYQRLMEACFRKYHLSLKPGHWITVEFHNSKNAVWNAIQEALISSGFIVADVRTLDKKQGTFQQVNATGAVKSDLVISAYKPREDFEDIFRITGGSLEGAWAFIRQHLGQLPVPSVQDSGLIETLAERQAYLLYDRMVAFHIQRGLTVPLSAPEFYAGLHQRYLERDEMYFTPSQAAEYDKRRLKAERVEQLSLFVNDEKSALQWVRRKLSPQTGAGPQTYQDLQPLFLKELRQQARHEEMPELREMLEDNFLQDDEGRWYVPDPDRQADLEALRQKALVREFNEYRQGKGRLKTFRSEAIRAGFSQAWREQDFAAIVEIAERLPPAFLEEEQQLLMYVHNAQLVYDRTPKQKSML